jgi:hypothetical protein
LNNVAFEANQTPGDGGGVYLGNGIFIMHGGNLGIPQLGNTAGGLGGGFHMEDGQATLDLGLYVSANQATRGGGLYLNGGTTTFGNVTVSGNKATSGLGNGVNQNIFATVDQEPGTTLTDPDDPGGKPRQGP